LTEPPPPPRSIKDDDPGAVARSATSQLHAGPGPPDILGQFPFRFKPLPFPAPETAAREWRCCHSFRPPFQYAVRPSEGN